MEDEVECDGEKLKFVVALEPYWSGPNLNAGYSLTNEKGRSVAIIDYTNGTVDEAFVPRFLGAMPIFRKRAATHYYLASKVKVQS